MAWPGTHCEAVDVKVGGCGGEIGRGGSCWGRRRCGPVGGGHLEGPLRVLSVLLPREHGELDVPAEPEPERASGWLTCGSPGTGPIWPVRPIAAAAAFDFELVLPGCFCLELFDLTFFGCRWPCSRLEATGRRCLQRSGGCCSCSAHRCLATLPGRSTKNEVSPALFRRSAASVDTAPACSPAGTGQILSFSPRTPFPVLRVEVELSDDRSCS